MIRPDLRQYWLKRGEVYQDEFARHNYFTRRRFCRQEKTLLKVLRGIQFNSVFECGIGFGRISKLILNHYPAVKLTGIDISSHQIENAWHYIDSERACLIIGAIQDVDIVKGSHDLVIAVEVLMHIALEEIEVVMRKLVNISRGHLINVDWQGVEKGVAHGYMFSHDFTGIYNRLGIDKVEVKEVPRTKQKIWHAIL